VVEAVAEQVHVDRDHVVGIRSLVTSSDKLDYRLVGCGAINGVAVADGDDTVITQMQGKRCFINKVIFGVSDPLKQLLPGATGKHTAFSAGDTDGDIFHLKDDTDLRLALNRNKTEIMCNAYQNLGSKWLIQPIFIGPKAQKSTPYPCTTALDLAGNKIVDANGAAFTVDYADSINASSMPSCP